MTKQCDYAERGFVIEDGKLLNYNGKDENVVIPDGVKVIGAHSLGYNVKKIYLPESVEKVEPDAFIYGLCLEEIEVAKNNPYFYSQDDCLIERATKKIIKGTRLSVIPQDGTVVAIGSNAFRNVDSARFCIRNCIKTIESCAFGGSVDVTLVIEAEKKPEGWADDWDSNEGELWNEVDWECGCANILLEWGVTFSDEE